MSNLKYIAAPRRVPSSIPVIAAGVAACAILISLDVRPLTQHLIALLHDHDVRLSGGLAIVAAGVGVGIWYTARMRRPSAEELERRRREQLAAAGRITDGVLIDARTLGGDESIDITPEVLIYSYRLAGVTYDCAQDVSMLPERVRGWRLDQPLQVRYDPRNPGNSVVVAETWSGLWQEHPGLLHQHSARS
ncbi:MAG TPA: hypothetical protein VM865_00735 [Acidobacteriaceae bacterium]|jgi:hypothetical protein|nr:hypothetical protein [Acidobacteriaceae bacterium]